jgi:hypothetical protein
MHVAFNIQQTVKGLGDLDFEDDLKQVKESGLCTNLI